MLCKEIIVGFCGNHRKPINRLRKMELLNIKVSGT
jgi:hypothetical protein